MFSFHRTVASIGVFCVVITFPSVAQNPPQPGAPAPGVTTGQTIGNIVKTAIQTAFPAVGTILNTIFAGKSDDSKVKVGDVKNQANTPATQQSVQQQITAAIQPKLQPVSGVAAELAVVNQFLLPAVTAGRYLTVLRADLAASPVQWADVSLQWNLVKGQLQKVKNVPDTQINIISDLWLRDKLSTIRNANDASSIELDAYITQKDAAKTTSCVEKLAPALDGVTAAAGYELANMQTDLTNLANWAKGAAGEVNPANPFKQIVNEAIK